MHVLSRLVSLSLSQDPLQEVALSNLELANATSGNEVEISPIASRNPGTLTKSRILFLLNYYDDNNTLLDYSPALVAGRTKSIARCSALSPRSSRFHVS